MSANEISSHIKSALRNYYRNRGKQAVGIEWDKEHDLKEIFEAAKAEGWSVEACAGVFWFVRTHTVGVGVIQIKVTEKDYLKGGTSNVAKSLLETGLISELAEALRKAKSFMISTESDEEEKPE